MKFKKIIALFMVLSLFAVTAVACGNSSGGSSSDSTDAQVETDAQADTDAAGDTQAADDTEAAKTEGGFKIGICQLVQHDALDAATNGFIDALEEEFGDDITIDLQNAQGDSTTCSTIVTGFVSNNYDLIMANATPALQAAVSATDTIPILGTSVTDYGTALEMADFAGTTGINVSGTSDLAPLDQQADMIKELVPDVQKVAILYCSAEANSDFQAKQVEESLDALGIAYQEYTFSDSNDMQAVVTTAASECDVFYIPTDNTAASNMTIVSNVTAPANIPVICGEENMCQSGGLATLSIDYYDLGKATGKQAIEILKNGADVSSMEVEYADATTKKYNAEYAELIGFELPDDYVAIEVSEETEE